MQEPVFLSVNILVVYYHRLLAERGQYRCSFSKNSEEYPSLVPRLPRPSGKDSLVFKVRIFGIIAYMYVNQVILAGRVGGASQINGISQLIWRYFSAVSIPLLTVLLKVASQLLTFQKILEE